MSISKKEFLVTVTKSRVIELKQFKAWLAKVEAVDGVDLANQMVRDGLLTEWQAKYLLTGRHRLDVGGYRLLKRVSRDTLGDRFLAIHRQLNRYVDILFFAADLSKQPQRRQELLDRASQVMELDHPNLSHVYDLDHEVGRYFLVTEHVDGAPWQDALLKVRKIEPFVRLLGEIVSGIEHLHQNEIFYGNLTEQDLWVDTEQRAKILNLAISQLRENSHDGDYQFSSARDWSALAELGLNSLSSISWSSPQDPAMAAIKNALNKVLSKPNQTSVGFLKTCLKEIEQRDSPWFQSSIDSTSVTRFDSSVLEDQALSELKPGTPSKSTHMNRLAADLNSSENDVSGFLTEKILAHPTSFLVSSFLLGFILIGSLTHFFVGGSPKQAIAVAGDSDVHLNSTGLKTVSEAKKMSAAKTSPAAARDDHVNQLRSTDTANIDGPIVESNDLGFDSTSDQNETNTESGIQAGDEKSVAAADGSLQARQKDVDPKVDLEKVASVDSTAEESSTMSDTESAGTESTASIAEAADQADQLDIPDPQLYERPFQKLPASIALPEVRETVPLPIGNVYIPGGYLMGAELISNEHVGPGRIVFDMERDESDNQAWNFTFARNPRDSKTRVATLKRQSDQLVFQWLDAAAEQRQVGYLQNCVLKIFTPEHTAWLALREPIEIEPVVLNPTNLSVSVPLEIDFAPAPEGWWIEVLKPKIAETSLNPNVIDLKRGLPGRVLLKGQDRRPLVWVNLALEVKAKTRLRVDLTVFEGQREAEATSEERFVGSPLKGIPDLERMILLWKQQEQVIGQQIAALEAQQAPQGRGEEKQRLLGEMRKRQTHAREYGTKFAEYYELLPKMFDTSYGVRIVSRLQDGIEVELAKSRMMDDQ